MKYISLENIRPLGDLGARTALLCGRMTAADYRPERIFSVPPSLVEPEERISVFFSLRFTASYKSPMLPINTHLVEILAIFSAGPVKNVLERCLRFVIASAWHDKIRVTHRAKCNFTAGEEVV